MQKVIDAAAAPTGIFGFFVGISPDNPSEWLVFFSTILVLMQIARGVYSLFKWFKKWLRKEND